VDGLDDLCNPILGEIIISYHCSELDDKCLRQAHTHSHYMHYPTSVLGLIPNISVRVNTQHQC